MVERQTRDCSSTVLSPRSFHLVPLVLGARGGLLFGGLEICCGARAVHFRLFSLCYPVFALSHLPSFTGRAESPAALQLPLLSLLWTILCKLHRCLRNLNHGQPVRSDALFKRQPLPLSSCGGTEGSLLHGHSAVAALSEQTGFVPLAVVYALGQTLYWRRLVPMLPLGLALVVRLGKLVYEG